MYKVWKISRAKGILLLFLAAAVLVAGTAASVWGIEKRNNNGEEGIPLPIIMYHGFLKDETYQGDYVISPQVLENDIQYLQSKGYTAVFMQDVLDYMDGKGTLPEKPVILSFDDGYYNNYLYAFPLAKQYKMKMVLAPIGYYTDLYSQQDSNHPNYSHITWDQAQEMLDSGYFEFQNHTYNLHTYQNRNGANKLSGESFQDYKRIVGGDIMQMQSRFQEELGICPTTLVFPFGAYCEDSIELAKQLDFEAVFTCKEKINYISREDPECLYRLGRFRRPGDLSSEKFYEEIVKLV